MKKKETKSMHFVPQCYLKRFSLDEETIYGVRKINNEKFRDTIENVCAINHLYRLDGETEEERQLVENFYDKVFEKDYNDIYKLLINPAINTITKNDRGNIIAFILSLFFRNSSQYLKFKKFTEINLEYCYNLISQNNLDKQFTWHDNTIIDFSKLTLNEVKKNLKEKNKQNFIRQHIFSFYFLLNQRFNDDILVKKIEDDNEFITSDFPVIMFDRDNKYVNPFNVANSIMLPIDTKHYVKLMPSDNEDDKISRRNIIGNFALVEAMVIYDAIFRNAQHYVLGTEASITKFQDIKIKYAHAFAIQ